MASLYDLAVMSVNGAPGTGTITLGLAYPPYLTFAQAGISNGQTVSYSITDGLLNSECGRGVYTSAGTTLTRNVLFSTNGNAAINASGASIVRLSALAEDLLFNKQISKSALYTVQETDNNAIIALTGATNYVLTFPTASTLDVNHINMVTNINGARAKTITLTGGSSFVLWPSQSVVIYNRSNVWVAFPDKQRWLSNGVTFNVDNVSGSDSATNDGLGTGSGAFLTVQHAWNVIQTNLDPLSTTTIIQLPTTTSTPIVESPTFAGAMPVGVGEITILGNSGTPTNCKWQPGSGSIDVTDYQSVTFKGVGFSIPAGGTLVSGSQHAIADFFSCDFGANPGGVNVAMSVHAAANVLSGCSVSGSCGQFAQISEYGSCIFSSIAVNGTPNVGFLGNCLYGGLIDFTALAFTGAGTISGQKFRARWAGTVRGDSGVTWPGGFTAGVASLGGIADAAITSVGAVIFANLPSSPIQGTIAVVTDSTTNTWGANVTIGGGGDVVLVWFNNSNWTVIGK